MTDRAAPAGDERPAKPRPAPVPDADSGPYWAAAHDGRLVIQRCERCGARQLYPRDRCLVCRGPVEWVEASGRGTVYSYTVIRQNYARPFRDWIPYVVALVDLEEGVGLVGEFREAGLLHRLRTASRQQQRNSQHQIPHHIAFAAASRAPYICS